MSIRARPLYGWLAAVGVMVIWSGWVVVSRLGVVQSLTIYDMAALRFTVAALAVTPFIPRYWPRYLAWWKIAMLSCGPGVPYVLFAFAGMQFAPASHAGILMNGTLPIFAAVIAWLWVGDRPAGWKTAGMAIILSGCVLIGWDRGTAGAGSNVWVGHLLFAGAALMLAAYMVATRVWGLTAMQSLVIMPVINLLWFGPVYMLFLPKALAVAPWPEITLQAFYQGLGPSILGVVFFTMAIRSIGPTPTAAVMAGVPGLATLLAIPVLGEWPSPLVWGGLAVTTTGIVLTAGWTPAAARLRPDAVTTDLRNGR